LNGRVPHASQHGYVPGTPQYFTQDNYGRIAPPGYAFNVQGELVQLPFEPWSQGPQMAWDDPQNPDYLEYAQGRMTLENQPSADPRLPARYGKGDSVGHRAPITHQDMTMVPQRAYLDTQGDAVPQQDEGTGSKAIFDMPASIARTRYILSKDIEGLVQVDAPQSGSPLLVVPTGNSDTEGSTPPFGGAVALGIFQWGHLGTQSNIVCDVYPSTLVKVPSVGSFMRITGRMAPRYFANLDTGTAPNIVRTYLLFPGGPALTNDSFSDLPPNIMELQGVGPGTIVAAGVQNNPINYSGWCALGNSATPSTISLPQRVFRGTVLSAPPAPAAPFTNLSRIPIPHGAQSVKLIGGYFNPLETPQQVPIIWTQNIDVTNMVAGPFNPETTQPIPLLQGATSIDVFAGNSDDGDIEVPFFAIFYLNV
jgi:hypothetical protein